MFIVMWENNLNDHIANSLSNPKYHGFDIDYYPNLNLSSAYAKKNDTLCLIDLRANGEFQELLAPYLLARDIFKGKLHSGIKTIELFVSDVNLKKPLSEYAQKLAHSFAHDYQREITVYTPCHHNYAMTLVIPPVAKTKQLWYVYGIKHADASNITIPYNLKNFLDFPKKELIWSGENFREWLHQTQPFTNDILLPAANKAVAS